MARNTAADGRSTETKVKMAEWFAEHEADYRDSDGQEVVYEDAQVVVVADHTGHELNEWASGLGVDRSELSSVMHTLARQVCDYSWSVADPVVFDRVEN